MTPELLISGGGLIKLGESAAKLKFKPGRENNARQISYIYFIFYPYVDDVM